MSRNILKLFLVLISIGVFVFSFNLILGDELDALYAKYFPCQRPISYSIVSFDSRFDISKEAFLDALLQAEKIWEEPISKNLFVYKEESKGNNDLKINLIYDYRQEATTKIHDLGLVVSDTRHSYDSLRAKYENLQSKYLKDKAEYGAKSVAFNKEQKEYTDKVNYWNNQNGAPEEEYEALNKEAASLKQEFAELQDTEKDLNTQINNINALITVINRLAKTLNLNASEINIVGKSQGEEFTQGEYKSGPDGEEINVYEFSTKDKLIRLLAHELGHALGLDHVENPDAIMYRLNENKNQKLTADDIFALKTYCKIK